jgi:hypothetical protein
MSIRSSSPVLEFTAGPGKRYFIQASVDLRRWKTIETTKQPGIYQFIDLEKSSHGIRFYRIVEDPLDKTISQPLNK